MVMMRMCYKNSFKITIFISYELLHIYQKLVMIFDACIDHKPFIIIAYSINICSTKHSIIRVFPGNHIYCALIIKLNIWFSIKLFFKHLCYFLFVWWETNSELFWKWIFICACYACVVFAFLVHYYFLFIILIH